jgi:hypothetical protein
MMQGPLAQAVPALVQRALAAGGGHGDNVTALGCTYLAA